MKRLILSVILAGTVISAGYGQGVPQPQPFLQSGRQPDADLPKFDLDFPGGTPQQLVDMIRKAVGTLNAIVPTEHKDVKLPPLKMHEVTAKQLFEALEFANQRTVPYQTGNSRNGEPLLSQTVSTIGFRTTSPITAESIWYFYVSKPQAVEYPKVVRYFQLSPYLTEYKIDDITTAIQAGWKMLGEAETPKLNFHQDTKLLIAVGQLAQLQTISQVLSELDKTLPSESREAARAAASSEPKPGRK